MNIGVTYALKDKQVWLQIDVPTGSTVSDAIHASGILNIFTDIDLNSQKVGIFGKLAKLDAALNEGDRVEIYREITADPKKVKRRDRDGEYDDDDD